LRDGGAIVDQEYAAMRKSYFVFVILAATAAGTHAQSSVTVYGLLDAGVVKERGCGGCTTRISSGVATGSRLGFRGTEMLNDSLSAVFAVEAGVLTDSRRSDQGGTLFGRQSFVGLDGNFGTITLGRQYNLQYLALTDVGDPFKGGLAGTATNLVGYSGKRVDNSIQYYSRDYHGVSAAAQYGAGEIAGDASSNRAWGISIGVERGPLVVRVAHQNRNVAKVAPATAMGNNMDAKNTIVAANVKLGAATAYAAYSANRGWGSSPLWNPDNPYGAAMATTPSTDSRDVLVGVALPAGATTFLASYIRKNDRDLSNRDADQVAVGATYAVSRRTDFYAAYSHIKNKNGAGYTVGNATESGSGTSAVNIGMRHAF
jgi:predicted porin